MGHKIDTRLHKVKENTGLWTGQDDLRGGIITI